MSAQRPTEHLTEAVALINNILASTETIRTLSNATTLGQQPITSTPTPDSVDSRLASLFPSRQRSMPVPAAATVRRECAPRYQAQQCFGAWTSTTRKKRSRPQYFDHFNKDVVLLPNPFWGLVCKQGSKLRLHKHGHILSAFEFQKAWDYKTVVERIRAGFGERIPEDVSLEFLMGCGSKLVAPKLQEGQELNGMLIHKVFKTKALYVRPSKTLLSDSDEENEPLNICTTTGKDDCIEVDFPETQISADIHNVTRAIPMSSHEEDGKLGTCSNDEEDVTIISVLGGVGTDTTPGCSNHDENNLGQSDRNLTTKVYDEDYSSYLTLVASISDESTDDEELNLAIMASMESQHVQNVPVQEILQDLSSKINTKQQSKFNINRSAVWEGALRGFRRGSYNPTSTICVKFSDDMGRHEEGVDLGGPRREFLRLLIETIASSCMFEGKENSKTLALNSSALRDDGYYEVGRAMAVSLVHGGPPPNFLSPTLFSLLAYGSANPVLEDIADTELLEKVQKVSESKTLEDLEKAKAPLIDYLANAGCLRTMQSIGDRDLLVHDIVMFQVIHRIQGPFHRFCEGLKTLGVLEKIQRYPDSFRALFCYEPCKLNADQLDDLFRISLSPDGSNNRAAEEIVVTFWRDYLQDAEEDEGPSKLQKILAFATGASVVPPIGFSPTPCVQFIHKDDDDFSSPFPMANTCINSIKLPLHTSYQVFKEKFDFALGNTYGFGRA